MVLSEHVRDWIHSGDDGGSDVDDHLSIWNLVTGNEGKILRHVVSHLWGGGWSSVFILDHTIVELWWHCNDHVVEVWVEVSSLWHIESERWVIVVPGQQVVWVVDQSRVVGGGLGQIWGPHAEVGILGLMDCHVWWPHSVVNNSLSKVPLLEEVTSVLLMCWMHFWKVDHLLHKINLIETLVHKKMRIKVEDAFVDVDIK